MFKNKYFKILFSLVLALILGGILVACGPNTITEINTGDNNEEKTTENNTENEENTAETGDNETTNTSLAKDITLTYNLVSNNIDAYDTIDETTAGAKVASIVIPATVEVTVNITFNYKVTYMGYWGGQAQSQTQTASYIGQGTAFFINSDGYLITNAHVVCAEDYESYTGFEYVSRTVQINYADSSEMIDCDIITYDQDVDLALLKVTDSTKINNLKYVTFFKESSPDSTEVTKSSLYYGELAYAIGNAKGIGISITGGIVSCPLRSLTSSSVTKYYVQTDAAINNGNSGGPLCNAYGAVIGIDATKFTSTSIEGIGFAIPTFTIFNFIDSYNETATSKIAYYYTLERAYQGTILSNLNK